jgi:asparagine synthase (glutamine-hydrolysing)
MCGIVGVRSYRAPVEREKVLSAMRALRHRGPDGEGHWISPDERTGLAHTRLSIIDLDTGAQPISSEDGRITIVVNGEFYGFEAIRRDLERRGHHFSTKSDSEILVHLYEEHGTGCLTYLRGEFAFVLWDETRQTVFAARDRFGIKPLYYAAQADGLYLASEAKALFAAGVPAAWDEDAVFRALFACVAQDQSLFRNVRQIPPGHYLLSSGSGGQLRRYWDADFPVHRHGQRVSSAREHVELVRSMLIEAVDLRMRADVPVGCLLSGGLDSSSVLGIASRNGGPRLPAFTITFDDADYDESSAARDAACHSGAELNLVSASDACLAGAFEESVVQGEIMLYNPHGTARYLLSRAVAQRGFKTMLAGEGADEIFAGYGFSRSAVLASSTQRRFTGKLAALGRLIRPMNQTQRALAGTSPWLARMSKVIDLPQPLLDSLVQRMQTMRSVLSPAFARRYGNRDPYHELFVSLKARRQIRGREPARQIIYLWMKTMFPGYVLTADRADMAHGVEVRLPFLDHVLFEHVREIPVATLAYGGEIKHLLREAAAPFIAPATRQRLKKPLMAPPFTANRRSPLRARIEEIVRDSETPFFERKAVVRLLETERAPGEASVDPLLMMAASLAVLQRGYRLS